MGPLRLPSFCKAFNCKSQKLSISICLSWANVVLTLLGPIFTCIFVPLKNEKGRETLMITTLWISYPVFFFSIGTLILIQFLDGCKTYCSPCCQSNCFPVRKLTYLNITDMDMELTREDVEVVKSKVNFLDILLIMCGIASVAFGIRFMSLSLIFPNSW